MLQTINDIFPKSHFFFFQPFEKFCEFLFRTH